MSVINVVEDAKYKWTTTTGDYLKEAPRIIATTYKVSNNAILQTVKSYYELAQTGLFGEDVSGTGYYDKLHAAEDMDKYVFPFFGDEVRSFNNTWGDSYVGSTNGSQAAGSSFLGDVKQLADAVITTANQFNALKDNKPGALFEPPKYYNYSTDDSSLTVDFILINTEEDAYNEHYKLVKKLITENRFTREDGNAFIVTPPYLWRVIVPGYRAIRWASCSVSINLIGSRKYNSRLKALIPEGYRVSLTFNSLYTEPSNFSESYNDTMNSQTL